MTSKRLDKLQVNSSELSWFDTVAISGSKAKALTAAYLLVMLIVISVMTLPSSLMASFPLVMFFINSCLVFFILSRKKIFQGNPGALLGGSAVIAISTQSLLFVLLTNSGIRWVSLLAIPTIFLIFSFIQRRRNHSAVFDIKNIDVVVLGIISILSFLFMLYFRAAHPIHGVREILNLPTDVPVFGTMVSAISATGLNETGFTAGFPIKYHWLSYGYLSSLDVGAPMDLIPLIAHFTPVLLFFVSLLLISTISSVSWMPSISQILGIAGALALGYVGVSRNVEFTNFPWFSPSTLLGGAIMLTLSIIVLRTITIGLTTAGIILLVLLTSFIFLAKISAGIIFIAALSMMTLYIFLFKRSMFRTQAMFLLISTLVGLTWYLIFFAGTGNELSLDPIFIIDSSGVLKSIVNLGVPFAALVAVAIPWAGIFIRGNIGKSLPMEQVWALSLGIPALLIYAITTAPDQNDKFFVIAAGIYIFPISFLLTLNFLQQTLRSNASRIRMLFYVLAVAVLSLALFSFSKEDFFDIRPLIFPILTLTLSLALGIIFTLLVVSQTLKSWRMILNASMSTLVIVSILFSLTHLTLPKFGLSAEASSPYIPIVAQERIARYLPTTIAEAQDLEVSTDQYISFVVEGPDSNTIERWVRFASGKPSFTAGETDVRRLTSASAGEVILSRNEKVQDYLDSGSPTVRDALCVEGLRTIWLYPHNGALDSDDSSPSTAIYNLKKVDLGCLLE
jgi:hypothetical protein